METSEKKICQSCGMPMNKIPDFGRNRDGSLNTEYCHYCYHEGEFTDAGISMKEKIDKNVTMAIKMGMPKEKAMNLANTIIPQLDRWKGYRKKN